MTPFERAGRALEGARRAVIAAEVAVGCSRHQRQRLRLHRALTLGRGLADIVDPTHAILAQRSFEVAPETEALLRRHLGVRHPK